MSAVSVFPLFMSSPSAGEKASSARSSQWEEGFDRQFKSALQSLDSTSDRREKAEKTVNDIVDRLLSMSPEELARLEQALGAFDIDSALVGQVLETGSLSHLSNSQLDALQRILIPVAQQLQLEIPALSSLSSPVKEVDVSVPLSVVDVPQSQLNEALLELAQTFFGEESAVEQFLKLLVAHVTGEETADMTVEELLSLMQQEGGALASLAAMLSEDGITLNAAGEELDDIFTGYLQDHLFEAQDYTTLQQEPVVLAAATTLVTGVLDGSTPSSTVADRVLEQFRQLMQGEQGVPETHLSRKPGFAERAASLLPLFAQALAQVEAKALGQPTAAANPADAAVTVSELSASSVVNASSDAHAVQDRHATLHIVKADGALGKPVTEQVQLAVQKAIRSGVDRFVIQLEPAELGRIEVRIDISSDNRGTITFSADNRDTLDLLQRDARALERALAEAGIDADSDDMQFTLSKEDDSVDQEEANMAYRDPLSLEEEAAYIDAITGHYTLTLDDGVDIKV